MHRLLAEIIGEKKREVKLLRERWGSLYQEGKPPFPIRDFKGAISRPGQINLITEIKFASPSAGVIRKRKDPLRIGRIYEEAGAVAISLLTDRRFFGGDISHMPRLKSAVSLPILRKDFIIDEIQVRESLLYGADAVLLIARILSAQQLKELLAICEKFGLAPLTEVHDSRDLEKAVDCGAEIIGINNRDLDTFKVDLNTTIELANRVADNKYIIVSESGIENRKDIQLLKRSGVQAVLVGTSIMRSDDLARKTRELVDAGHGDSGRVTS
jgi:indole-3-glycerol phosphate synthase